MVTAEQVKELRERTGAGIMDCKKVLVETDGNIDKAVELLREKGLAKAAKKASRIASEGLVDCYIHNGKYGAMVEVNSETDFVANNEEFKRFVRDVAMHVAASAPKYVSRADVPEDVVAHEKEVLTAQAVTATRNNPDASSVVVFMTDGIPTYRYGTGTTVEGNGSSTAFDDFNQAVEAGKNLKAAGNTIYTVGLLTGYTTGSANMDLRSFKLNFEVNAFIYDKSVINEIKEDFMNDLKFSEELEINKFNNRKLRIKIKESLYIFVPIKIPSSSKMEEVIKGYVLTKPLVNTFLRAAFFIEGLLIPVGIHANNTSDCLKFALFVCNPILSNNPSILFVEYSNSCISSI